MRLAYVPIPGSHHVYLNGIEQQEGVDWSDDGTGLLTFLAPMGEVSGDEVEVLYAHYGQVVQMAGGIFVASAAIGSFSDTVRGTSPAHLAGDLLVSVTTTTGRSVATPAGWSLGYTNGAADPGLHVFHKVGSGSEPQWADAGGIAWFRTEILAYRGVSWDSLAGPSNSVASTTHTTPASPQDQGHFVHALVRSAGGSIAQPTSPPTTLRVDASNTGSSAYLHVVDILNNNSGIDMSASSASWESVAIRMVDA